MTGDDGKLQEVIECGVRAVEVIWKIMIFYQNDDFDKIGYEFEVWWQQNRKFSSRFDSYFWTKLKKEAGFEEQNITNWVIFLQKFDKFIFFWNI